MFARLIGILVILALLGGGGYGAYRMFIATSSNGETPIPTVAVDRQDISQVIQCVGEVEPALFTDLKAEVSGRIEKIHIEEGDRVEKDDLLLELDRRELETEMVEQEHQIEAARLRLEKVKLDLDAKRDLREKGFVPEREFADADIDFKLAENELAIQHSQLQLLQEKLTKTKVHAPHGGVILDHDLTEGMVITGVSSFNEGTVLMRVAQLSELQVETEISEVDIDQIERGKTVALIFDSLPDLGMEGRITFVSPSAQPRDKSTSSANKARVFPITIAFSANQSRVRPGMTAQAHIVIAEAEQVQAAPLSSVFLEEGENVVYVQQQEDSYDRRTVTIGISDHHVVEISGGVAEGDLLATVRPPDEQILTTTPAEPAPLETAATKPPSP